LKNRDLYMRQLLAFKDKKLIKVITGMRRCGKSTLLDLFERDLIEDGVKKENIIHINFESMKYDRIREYTSFYKLVEEKIPKESEGRTYLLLDEIQQVAGWQKAVNSLSIDYDTDIYITGSNAYLLSSELATLLSGRYIEIKMLPLSFREHLEFKEYPPDVSMEARFEEYLKYGALPTVSQLNQDDSTIATFLLGVYHTVLVKDVLQRNTIHDAALLENLAAFLFDNIGNIVSSKKISDYLNSSGRKTTNETIDNYLSMLEKAFLVYRVRRFDIKGKQYLKTLGKYYVPDTGIRNAVLGYHGGDYGHLYENIVYFELLRRGYQVAIGKAGELEVDFVASRQDVKKYYQVTVSLLEEAVREREKKPLMKIEDNYEKIILSMDKTYIRDYEGIRQQNIIDFLLEEDNA